jgi:uncharacterized protein YjiS (DUF1127 family)
LKENLTMGIQLRDSLYRTHGINTERRRQQPRRWAGILLARIGGFLVEFKRAIETELAARQAIAELSNLDDHMLRDLGITRTEIEAAVRRPGTRVGTDEAVVISSDDRSSIVPGIIPTPTRSNARREQELRGLSSWLTR